MFISLAHICAHTNIYGTHRVTYMWWNNTYMCISLAHICVISHVYVQIITYIDNIYMNIYSRFCTYMCVIAHICSCVPVKFPTVRSRLRKGLHMTSPDPVRLMSFLDMFEQARTDEGPRRLTGVTCAAGTVTRHAVIEPTSRNTL